MAVLLDEEDAPLFRDAIIRADEVKIAAPTLLEIGIVADRRGPETSRRLDKVVRAAGLEVIAFDEEMARVAREAYRDFGRGSGHTANLNFGDCFAYALATITGDPLLFKGDDFVHTDVRSALG